MANRFTNFFKENENFGSGDSPIAWHPAFVEAIQMELEAYQDALEFCPEFQLSSEPLRIDCVIIRKTKEIAEEHKALVIAQNMINLGLPFETVVSATQLEPEKVQMLYQPAQ